VFDSFVAEAMKMVRRPAYWILLGIGTALALAFGYIIPYLIYTHPPKGMKPQDRADVLAAIVPHGWLGNEVGGFPLFGAAFVLIAGVLAAGSEYGWGTVATVLTRRPRRLDVLGGKLLALVGFALVYELAMIVPGAPASYLAARRLGAPVDWPSLLMSARALGSGQLVLGFWALAGALLAILFRGTALAIGLGLVYLFVVENLVSGFAGQLDALRAIQKLLPGVNAGALLAGIPGTKGSPGVSHVVGTGHALLLVALYATLIVLVASALFRQRDVA
jgi:hypothetical protein